MAEVYELYNKYMHINGRWELLNGDNNSAKVKELLTFKNSMTVAELTAFDINDASILAGYCYNISENFTTDDRFVEGAGVSYPAGSCITVVTVGSQKYFKYLGRVFNIDYIEGEIHSLETIINNIEIEWNKVNNKPFNLVGEGLEITNGTLNIKTTIEAINALKAALENLNFTWSAITNKPFTKIGSGLSVTDDTLNAEGLVNSINEIRMYLNSLQIAWNNVTGKPFTTIGEGLKVTNNVLEALIPELTWNNITGKPFNSIYSSDFYVSSNQLRIQSRYNHNEIYSSDMQTLKSIIQS